MSFFYVPGNRNASDLCAKRARSNGCKPHWSEYYEAWCCSCKGGTHSADQQCSIINDASSRRRTAEAQAFYSAAIRAGRWPRGKQWIA